MLDMHTSTIYLCSCLFREENASLSVHKCVRLSVEMCVSDCATFGSCLACCAVSLLRPNFPKL